MLMTRPHDRDTKGDHLKRATTAENARIRLKRVPTMTEKFRLFINLMITA